MANRLLALGGVFGALGVATGAFGAHALRTRIGAEAMQWFETGVHYHLVHALALVGVGLAGERCAARQRRLAGALFAAGIVLFSGSLYALALGAPRRLGVVTPVGGTAWIVGWIALALGSWRGEPTVSR